MAFSFEPVPQQDFKAKWLIELDTSRGLKEKAQRLSELAKMNMVKFATEQLHEQKLVTKAFSKELNLCAHRDIESQLVLLFTIYLREFKKRNPHLKAVLDTSLGVSKTGIKIFLGLPKPVVDRYLKRYLRPALVRLFSASIHGQGVGGTNIVDIVNTQVVDTDTGYIFDKEGYRIEVTAIYIKFTAQLFVLNLNKLLFTTEETLRFFRVLSRHLFVPDVMNTSNTFYTRDMHCVYMTKAQRDKWNDRKRRAK